MIQPGASPIITVTQASSFVSAIKAGTSFPLFYARNFVKFKTGAQRLSIVQQTKHKREKREKKKQDKSVWVCEI